MLARTSFALAITAVRRSRFSNISVTASSAGPTRALVTPSSAGRLPGLAGEDLVDGLALQRHQVLVHAAQALVPGGEQQIDLLERRRQRSRRVLPEARPQAEEREHRDEQRGDGIEHDARRRRAPACPRRSR